MPSFFATFLSPLYIFQLLEVAPPTLNLQNHDHFQMHIVMIFMKFHFVLPMKYDYQVEFYWPIDIVLLPAPVKQPDTVKPNEMFESEWNLFAQPPSSPHISIQPDHAV